EILASSPSPSPSGDDILRVATDEDLGRARRADADRSRRLAECERIFGDGAWPLILVDAEPLLDEGRTVLYYMGPHHLDDDGLRDALRSRCGLDAVFEPVGLDAAEEETDAGPAEGGCGSCGSGGGCGSGGCG